MSPFPANVPPADATAFLRDKLALPTETWTDILGAAHARAFVVAGANTEAIVTDFQVAITKMIEEGGTISDFAKHFDRIVEERGWNYRGSRGWRIRVIYETNTRMAYMAAKWKAFVDNRLKRPYLRYVGILDDRIRPLHRQWHDTVLPVEHPWWRQHFPPNGWGCRCDVQSLSEKVLARRGLRLQPEAPPVVLVTRQVTSARGTGFVTVPKGIDPGFDYNVGQAAFGSGHAARGAMLPLLSPLPTVAGSIMPPVMPKASPGPAISGTPEVMAAAIRNEVEGHLADPAGAMIAVGQALAESLVAASLGPDGTTDPTRFLPLLRELVESPQEIWTGFVADGATGKVTLLRRYLRLVRLPGGPLVLACDCAGREVVLFTVTDPEKLPLLRTGLRLRMWTRPPT